MFDFKTSTHAALTLSAIALAQSCSHGEQGYDIHANDFNSLVSAIRNNSLNPALCDPFKLERRHIECFSGGSAGIKVTNGYVFKNTHVYLNDVADGAQSVFDKCNAQRGSTTIRGESGLKLKLDVYASTGPEC